MFYLLLDYINASPIPAKEPKNTTKLISAIIPNTIAPIAIQKVILVHRAALSDASLALSNSPLMKSDSTFDAFTMAAMPIKLNTFPHNTKGNIVTNIDSTIHDFGIIGTSCATVCCLSLCVGGFVVPYWLCAVDDISNSGCISATS